jgi:hypothetical protein
MARLQTGILLFDFSSATVPVAGRGVPRRPSSLNPRCISSEKMKIDPGGVRCYFARDETNGPVAAGGSRRHG